MTTIQCKLIFDSSTDSLPELRGGPAAERHLIYEGGDILLDLLLKQEQRGSLLYIGGQVMPANGAPEEVSNVLVMLDNGATQAKTFTNALGEFSFRCEPEDASLDVTIIVGSRRLLIRGLSAAEPRFWQVVASVEPEKAIGNSTR